ncbi:MAG: Flp pilus assembly protein CpaB [Planctomycetes bacterium]|nr:Flp pilus assembly protein CpaB [Planctomycetota bacterium]
MSGRTALVAALASAFGVSAAVGVNQLRSQEQGRAKVETVQIVVAAVDIPRGVTLTNDLVKTYSWPQGHVPPGAMTKVEDVLERAVSSPLVKDEPVLSAKLSGKDAGRGLAALVSPGMRAFTIHTPTVASGVAGFILPGNRVDVLLTVGKLLQYRDPTGLEASTTTLLQNLEILAVDQRLDAPSDNKVDPKDLRSVTLLVTPDQAAKLSMAQNLGTLHLTLRNPEDVVAAATQPVTLNDLRFYQEGPQNAPEVSEPAAASDEEAVAAAPTPVVRQLKIRTLRGRQSGLVRIQLGE